MAKKKTTKKSSTSTSKKKSTKALKPSIPAGLEKTKATTDLIIKEIIQEIKTNIPYNEIVEKLAKKHRKSPSSIKGYHKKAVLILKDTHIRDLMDMKAEYVGALYNDMKEAYTMYQMSDNVETQLKWFKTYLDIKKAIKDVTMDDSNVQQQTNIQINIDRDDEGL